MRGLSPAQCRQGPVSDHRRQCDVRSGEPRSRAGDGASHAQDLVGEHGARVGLGPGRLHRQPDRPPVSRQQLLQHRPGQRLELLRVGGRDRVRQRHLGVLRRDQPCVAERLHQHDAGRHRARRDVPPYGLAGAQHTRHRARAAVERDWRDGARSESPGSIDSCGGMPHA